MAQIKLKQRNSTTLYVATNADQRYTFYFLLGSASGNPPNTLTLDDTWGAFATNKSAGFYCFFNPNKLDDNLAASMEQALRQRLAQMPPPTGGYSSSFMWVSYVSQNAKVEIKHLTLLPLMPDTSQKQPEEVAQAIVAEDTYFILPPAVDSIGFGRQTPVQSTKTDGFIDGFRLTYPPLSQAYTVAGPAIQLLMAGEGLGCFNYSGLITSAFGPPPPGAERKTLVQTRLDPFVKGSQQFLTTQDYLITQAGGQYYLSPANS